MSIRLHFISVITTIILLSLISCDNDLSKIPNNQPTQDYSKSVAKDVTIIIVQNDFTKAEITAPQFLSNDEAQPPYLEMPKGVKARFFDRNLQPESILTAKYARYYDDTKNILVKDSVIVINKDGHKMITEELIWNNKMEKFYTDKQVVIYGKDQIVYGDGLEANKDFTNFKIIRQRGIIPVTKGTIPDN